MITAIDEKLEYVYMVAGVVIKQGDKFLLVQEKQPKVYGLWNLPAGKVEKGDTIEETALKEAREEVGFEVKLIKKIGIYQASAQVPPKHAFLAEITDGRLTFPQDEILDARWFDRDEILAMKDKIRDAWVWEAIEECEK